MARPKKLSTINLVPQDEFDRSVVGRALKWSLTTGKSIVIITEFVVILAFLSRFKLDRDLNDLNEVIIQKQAIVESFSDVETQMIDIQARMTLVEQISNTSVNVSRSMDELALLTPLDVTLESVDLGQNSWLLKGSAGTEAGFATFISRLENSGKFAEIQVGNVSYDQRKGGLIFDLEAVFPKTETTRAGQTSQRVTPSPTVQEEEQ